MKIFKIVLLVMTGFILSSCNNDSLIFVTKTSFGVEAGVGGAENGINIGFKRFEGVIDPLNKKPDGRHEAQSVLAKLNFGVSQSNNDVAVAQWFATGEAATELARNGNGVIALIGKNIVSFRKGLNLSQLSLIKNIYSENKVTGNNEEIINSMDDVSKSILLKFAKLKEGKCPSYNGFADLILFYNKVNKPNGVSGCELKTGKKSHQLNREIDIKLGGLIAQMIDKVKQLIGG